MSWRGGIEIKIPKELIIEKIMEKKGLSHSEVQEKIDSKLKQLSGLISEEGAAHIVANQLGVKVMEESGKTNIKNVIPGMKNIELIGKVTQVYEVREFKTDKREGKVGSFIIADETGTIRVVCWNEQADILAKLSPQQVISIKSAYARDNRGRNELHINSNSVIEMSDEVIKEPKILRKNIKDLKESDSNVEVLGTVVQAYDPRFFEVCSKCGKRMKQKDEKYVCDIHPDADLTYSYVLNVFLDDGTESIRTVLWRNQAQKLTGKTNEELIALKDQSFEDIKNDLLGTIVKLVGRVNKNQMFERLEFVPNLVFPNPDPKKELERLEKSPKTEENKETIKPTKNAAPVHEVKEEPKKVEPETPAAKKPEEKIVDELKAIDEEILSVEDIENL